MLDFDNTVEVKKDGRSTLPWVVLVFEDKAVTQHNFMHESAAVEFGKRESERLLAAGKFPGIPLRNS